MQLPYLRQILTLLLLLTSSVSCTPKVSPNLPKVKITDPPPTASPALKATLANISPLLPTDLPKRTPIATGVTSNHRGSTASQNLPLEIPAHPIDVILSRPTQHSITLSILAYQDFQGFIEYGSLPDTILSQSPQYKFFAGQPLEILIDSLQANTQYTYRIRYHMENTSGYAATEFNSFHTQRPQENLFTFTVQADSHLDSNSDPQLYVQTLMNERTDQPDFQIDLGDTFMTDKYRPYTDAKAQYLAQRYYLSLVGQTVPLFLVLGNHDGEGAPRGGAANELAAWSAILRKQYFPNPIPDDFFSGNSLPEESVGLLQDYYAWDWGDALFIVLDPYWFTPSKRDSFDNWHWTLGDSQYEWLKKTLETNHSKWKFVFIHQLIGGLGKNGRGGVEAANYYEWGGYNLDGSWGFAEQRPGWIIPIHQLFVANKVTAVFHGHDHLFAKQELDGIIYQAVPQPSASRSGSINSATEYGYLTGVILGSSGHLRVTVTPQGVTFDYVRSRLTEDEKPSQQNGQVDYSYSIK